MLWFVTLQNICKYIDITVTESSTYWNVPQEQLHMQSVLHPHMTILTSDQGTGSTRHLAGSTYCDHTFIYSWRGDGSFSKVTKCVKDLVFLIKRQVGANSSPSEDSNKLAPLFLGESTLSWHWDNRATPSPWAQSGHLYLTPREGVPCGPPWVDSVRHTPTLHWQPFLLNIPRKH